MQADFEINSDADEPLVRDSAEEEDEEPDVEQELLRAAQFEFREIS